MSFSNYLENKILDHVFRNTSYTPPTTVYIKLHTGDPGEDGTSNAATETTRKSASWSAASSGSVALSGTISWTSVAGTETISHISAWDASTSGNCLGSGALTASKAVTAGDTLELTALTISVD